MGLKIRLYLYGLLLAVAGLPTAAQVPTSTPKSARIVIPRQVASIVRPVLEEKQRDQHDERRLGNLLYGLIQRKGNTADEALVVLLCFDIGQSQEEEDAVIARGRRMLSLLRKYRNNTPTIPGHNYDRLLRGAASKSDAFEGTEKAIRRGWHSTADNPEG
jgi:hypothetical protein